MQRIRKLNLKLLIHYSEDWESLKQPGRFVGEKMQDTVGIISILDVNFKGQGQITNKLSNLEICKKSVPDYKVEMKLQMNTIECLFSFKLQSLGNSFQQLKLNKSIERQLEMELVHLKGYISVVQYLLAAVKQSQHNIYLWTAQGIEFFSWNNHIKTDGSTEG